MKVIMSAPYVYPFSAYAGAERYVYWLSKYLVKLGCGVKIITSPYKKGMSNVIYDGIEYEFIGLPIPVYRKIAWLYHYIFTAKLAQYLKTEEFDILHSFHITSFAYLHYKERKPVVIEPFGLGRLCEVKLPKLEEIFREVLLKRPLLYCMTHCEAIASEGSTQALELSELFGVPNDKFFNLPDGVELDLIRGYVADSEIKRVDYGLDDAYIVLMNVNRLDRNKGISYLVEALDILNRDLNVKLILVGKGPEEDKIKRQIKELDLEDKVVHLKDVSDEKMFQLYTLADISVTPTLWEGLPLVMLEAMAAGKPIVATNISDIPNVIDGNGITVPPANARAIADAVLGIYRSHLIEVMGARSLEIIKDYDWELTAKKALVKYEELVEVK